MSVQQESGAQLLAPAGWSNPARERVSAGRLPPFASTAPPTANRRILFVAEAFGGGMFEITRMQAEGLARLGHDVAIAYGRRPETPADLGDLISESVTLIPLPWRNRSILEQIKAQRKLRRVVKSWRPDIIHLMSSFAGLHGALASRGTPTVYTPQAYAFTMMTEPAYKRWIYLLLESFVASRVSVVGACSNSEGEQARSLPGAESVVVVPNGIDELSNPTRSLEEREATVVGIGRPLPQRRPEACARILASVAPVGKVKWIGGGRDDSPGTMALVNAGVPMTGWMPRADTLRTLGKSMIYLHWTAWDGLPLSVLEAMALDVIVVASDIGPNREVLGPEQVCRTEDEAAELILAVLTDERLRGRFLENQRERRAAYGSNTMVAQWVDVYSGLIAAQS
jgi:glycosyltransferase involved in cell wall biosynthesis